MMLFYRTGCETVRKLNINGTEIKIEKDYIDGYTFESIVSQSYSDTKDKSTKYNKMFTRKNHLKNHTMIYTGENPYKCDVCNKLFTLSTILNRHMRTHTGENPFKCEICDKVFSQAENLKFIQEHKQVKNLKNVMFVINHFLYLLI